MSIPRLVRVPALVTIALLAGACQGSTDGTADTDEAVAVASPSVTATDNASSNPDPEEADAADSSIGTQAELALVGREGEISRSYVVIVEDFGDGVDDAHRLFRDRGRSLDALLLSLPDAAPPGASPDVAEQYATMIEALEVWATAVGRVGDEMESRAAEIEPLIEDWIAAGTGGPPAAFVELLRGDEAEATAFGDACATFAATVDRTLACYLIPPAEAVVTSFEVEIGSLVLTFDVEDVGFSDEFGDGVVIGTPRPGTIMVAAPQPVANPDEPLHRQNGEPIPNSLPWPDDLEAWYSQLPVELLGQGEETLSNGVTWSYTVLGGTADAGGFFALVDAGDTGAWVTGRVNDDEVFELVLWETTIDGQQVIAVSDGRPDRAWEDHFAEARQVLDTVRVVSG